MLELADGKRELFNDGDWIESPHITHSGNRLLQTGNVGVGRLLNRGTKRYISDDSFRSLKCKEVRPGDILICRLADPAGRACLVEDIGEQRMLTSVDVTIYRPNPRKADTRFLVAMLSTPKWFQEVSERCGGSTRTRIARSELGKIKLRVPDVYAQSRIADVLADAADLVAALEQVIAKKQAIKQGLMQQLLTGRTRLPGFDKPWQRTRLGDLLAYEQPGRYLVSSTAYGEVGTPVLTAGKTFLLGRTTETHGVYEAVPVIIFDDFTTASKYVNFSFKAKSSAMKMLSARPGVNLRYVYERMQLMDFAAVDHKRRWIAEYSKMEVDVPGFDEQAAVTLVLADADKEILAIRDRLVKARAIRNGMMQQLLAGRTRLPVEVAS